jgi:hypothetical protein
MRYFLWGLPGLLFRGKKASPACRTVLQRLCLQIQGISKKFRDMFLIPAIAARNPRHGDSKQAQGVRYRQKQ